MPRVGLIALFMCLLLAAVCNRSRRESGRDGGSVAQPSVVPRKTHTQEQVVASFVSGPYVLKLFTDCDWRLSVEEGTDQAGRFVAARAGDRVTLDERRTLTLVRRGGLPILRDANTWQDAKGTFWSRNCRRPGCDPTAVLSVPPDCQSKYE